MAKSEITKVLSERLEELTEKKRDIDYRLSDKKQAEEMDIPYPSFVKYKKNTAECPISAVVKMAKYYNVSTDYLLGKRKDFTTNDELKFVGDYTGLNQQAIAIIKSMKNFGSICYENTEVSGENAFEALNEYLSNMICEKVSVYLADMKIANADFLLHCLIKRIYEDDRHKCNESGKIPANMACFDHNKLADDIKEKSEKCDMGYFRTSKIYEEFLKQYQCNTIGEYYDIKDIYERLYDTFGYTKEQVDEKVKEIWKNYDEKGYKQWQP